MRPQLQAAGRPELSTMYDAAVRNLLDVNSVPGRSPSDPPRFIRAGAGYPTPWTRDAALNCWGAASLLEPQIALDTLRMVCDVRPDGRRIIAQDDQWWDQILWLVAAEAHCVTTGDLEFLAEAFAIGTESLAILHRDHFRDRFGLYAGGALMQDGISGYPSPPNERDRNSSFVLDYPGSHEIMCLSTNAIYVAANQALGRMAAQLGQDPAPFGAAAGRLAGAINERLWLEDAGTYGYFLDPAGTVDRHEEAAGLALTITFGIADERRRDLILERTHREPYGVVNVWPHFPDRYSAERPGRHNVMVWPMVMGLFGDAAAAAGRADVLEEILGYFGKLFAGSDGHFFELYHPKTGAVDGGRQCGQDWPSQPDQTWSATAFLRLIHTGLAGLRFHPDGITFTPVIPAGIDRLELRALPYRDAVLDMEISGGSGRISELRLDDRPVDARWPLRIPAGTHRIRIRR